MLEQDHIIEFIRANGPTIPSKVAKNINTDILLASAHLSDLAAQGKVNISFLKIGGTPLYYLPGQEEQLFKYAESNLKKQDFQVLQLLQEKKILREQDLGLLPRYALRTLKDFAVPLNVNINGQKELFWKWHLLPETEINPLISNILSAEFKSGLPESKLESPESKLEIPLSETESSKTSSGELGEETTIKPLLSTPVSAPASSSKIVPEEPLMREKMIRKKATRPKGTKENSDLFFRQLENFIKELNLHLESKEIIRRNGEMNLLLKVPSPIGKLNYFGKVKNKFRVDEKDLSSAYLEAQMKKLPLLFIYTQELTKKAQEMINRGAFENMVVKQLK